MTPPTREQSLRAKRMLSHAILYVGPDEPLAIGTLKVALSQIYSEHYNNFTGRRGNGNGHQCGRMVRHYCTDCQKYKTAERSVSA